MNNHEKVNIRPQVTVLSMLKHLEYETWYALAEFVDNAIASFQKNEEALKAIEGESFKLRVNIEINESEQRITIRDNAAGIAEADYPRAFRAAEIPPDRTGLSEFGMGMKSAACWFADKWQVTTTALGEGLERTVRFDMQKIFANQLEELDVAGKPCENRHHYTTIELFGVNRMPKRRGLSKVKNHLRSIYRDFIRKGLLTLKIDGEELAVNDPKILHATKYDNPNGEPILWRKEISLQLGDGMSIKGFAAIREKGSTSEAGFALFRRGRVIEGSFDNGFRPDFIFGAPNSYRYQRVFGELHLDGFDVSFTKKGIQWDDNLEIFLKALRDDIDSSAFPLLQQAEQYRVRATEKEYQAAEKALIKTTKDLKKSLPRDIADAVSSTEGNVHDEHSTLAYTEKTLHREIEIRFNKENWRVSIELSYDPSLKELIEIGDSFVKDKMATDSIRQIGIRLSLTHPFMVHYAGAEIAKIEPILRIVAALGLSEAIAKKTKIVGDVRRNFNDLILYLSKQD